MSTVCDNIYLYNSVFTECGQIIRTLFLDPVSIITDPLNSPNPYPIYETREDYDADTVNSYKGILVWQAHAYYASMANPSTTQANSFTSDAGFYVIPSFGDVTIVPNVEYKQMLALTFDSNASLDYDPYGTKISNYISVVVNNIYRTLEQYGNELIVNGQRPLFIRLAKISKGSPVTTSTFERRIALFEMRYCQCYCT